METISKLRTFPEPKVALAWPEYADIDSSEKTLSDLTAILQLDNEHKLQGEENHWLPVHAWRILSQRRAAQALPHLIECLISAHEEDDWTVATHLPRVSVR